MPTISATARLYFQDTFVFSHNAVISAVNQNEKGIYVRLNQTIFHPKGGGQLDDLGTIESYSVKGVLQNPDGTIDHYLEVDSLKGLSELIGKEVLLVIDQQRRLENAALHSAGHILAALVEKKFPMVQAYKAHHYPNEAAVFFKIKDVESLPPKEEIQKQSQEIMTQALSDNISIVCLEQSSTRMIKIADHHPVGCGGTHLPSGKYIKDFLIRSIKIKKDELKIGYDAHYNS